MITHNGTYLLHATHHGMPIYAATMGGKMVFNERWLHPLTQQAIVAAFGAEGTEVIAKTNDYLNGIAQTDPQRALQLSGFINQHPLDAALYGGHYVQDGLVFQMDRAYECTAAKWKDFIGGVEFNGTNMQIVDDVPYFDGSAYYTGPMLNHGAFTHTIEVVLYPQTTGEYGIYREDAVSGEQKISLVNRQSLFTVSGNPNSVTYTKISDTNVWLTVAANKDRGYMNKLALNRDSDNCASFNGTTGTYIGARTPSLIKFTGKIACIRIYNRLLTEAEILANQDIDLKRFTLTDKTPA